MLRTILVIVRTNPFIIKTNPCNFLTYAPWEPADFKACCKKGREKMLGRALSLVLVLK